MGSPRKHESNIRDRLLAAAGDIFAEKGYRNSTIAEICGRAGANIAAVNYHFRSKKALYIETWQHCFAESVRKHPPEGGVDENAPPEIRLRGLVKALIFRIADEDNREFLILQKELSNPTGFLHEAMHKELWPQHERTTRAVRDILGPEVSDMQVEFCVMSIISQCIDPIANRRAFKSKRSGRSIPPSIDDIVAYSNHVVKFSLAGMRALREEEENMRTDMAPPHGGKDPSSRK